MTEARRTRRNNTVLGGADASQWEKGAAGWLEREMDLDGAEDYCGVMATWVYSVQQV